MTNKKSVSKSVRMTQYLYDYVNNYRGSGFNEKFENVIVDAMDSSRQSRLAYLDRQISHREEILDDLRIQLDKMITTLRNARY